MLEPEDDAFWLAVLPVWDDWMDQDERIDASIALFQQGRFRDAYDAAVEPLKEDDELIAALLVCGWALLGMQKPKQALSVADRLISLEPGYWRAHMLRAWSLLLIGRKQQALDSATLAVEVDPEDLEALAAFGQVAAQLPDKASLAEKVAVRVLKADPGSASGHEIRGDTYSARGHWSAAVGAYQKALDQEPNTERLLGKLAEVQLRWFSRRDAYLSYRRLVELHPDSQWLVDKPGSFGDAYVKVVLAIAVIIWAAALEPAKTVGVTLLLAVAYTAVAPIRRSLYLRLAPKAMAKAGIGKSWEDRNPDLSAGIGCSIALFALLLISLS